MPNSCCCAVHSCCFSHAQRVQATGTPDAESLRSRLCKRAVGEHALGLINGVLVLLILPVVDDLGQPVQQQHLVPASTSSRHQVRNRTTWRTSKPVHGRIAAHLAEIHGLVSRAALSSSQASFLGQKKYSVRGLVWPWSVMK